MNQNNSVRYVPGVGEKLAVLFGRLGIETVEDLIYHYPRRYDDFSNVSLIKNIKPGAVTLQAQVISVAQKYVRRGLHITEALISDESGSLKITWFNQPYRAAALKKGVPYYISGEYAFQKDRYSIINPAMELTGSFPVNTARIVPIYPETKGLKSHQIRKIIRGILPQIQALPETIPFQIVAANSLMPHAEALQQLHFPDSAEFLNAARRRLGFEELYELTLAALLNKQAVERQEGTSIPIDEVAARDFASSLPFNLTDAQRKAAWQVLKDMERVMPMNRLLEGDVGSGKTVVAAMAILLCTRAGFQAAYMAPTEILARQQYEEVGRLLAPFGVRAELFIGAMTKAEKSRSAKLIESGEAYLVIGTHALIEKHPVFKSLALVVIDEQHRFGVNQREKLLGKAESVPHVLTMTATPIPRSLALTLYGELDVSVIDQLPPGRKSVKTKVVSPAGRVSLYQKIDEQLSAGRQAYVVCPLIDESDTLGVKSVSEEFKRLDTGPFKHRRIALMHGRLKTAEKERVMRDFTSGKYDILVSTTVIEVGVNVPNANTILIEGAERFGLAQLHQLRGRVKRGDHQPYCYLVPSLPQIRPRRLRALETTDDGFKLAELDLELRGPGEIYGYRQSGVLDLRLAKLTDTPLIAEVRRAAQKTLDESIDLLQYPRLSARIQNLRKITNLN